MNQRFDIVYTERGPEVEPHFCRDHDCFGTNTDHGMTLEEAAEEIADWYSEQAALYSTMTHGKLKTYIEDE